MSAKQDLKILLAKENATLTEAVNELRRVSGKNYNLKNFCAKLRIDSLRYSEFKQIAKNFGYDIELVKGDIRFKL
jgi:predicted transcriptional regulator